MKKAVVASGFLLMAVLIFAGGGQQKSVAAQGGGTSLAKTLDIKGLHIGIVYSQPIPFFDPCDVAWEDLKKQYEPQGVKITRDIPQANSVNNQIEVVENLLTQGVDGLIICSVGDGLDVVINEAIEKGVPVIMFCVDNVNSKRISYVGTSQVKYSENTAEYLAKLMGGKGRVVGHGGVSTAPDQLERADAFKAYMNKNYPGIQIMDIQYGEGNASRTLSNIKTMYQNIKPDGFYVFNASSGSALVSVLTSQGKGNCKVVSDNDNAELILAIRNGLIDATQTQRPYTMVIKSFELMLDMLTKAKMPPSEYIFTDTLFITKENSDQYYDTNGRPLDRSKF